MCDRWGSRAHRIEERLARELETAVAGSTPTPDLLSSARPHELEEEVRAADFAREHNERQARELRGRIGAHPELDAFTGELEHARSALDTLRARIQEAKR